MYNANIKYFKQQLATKIEMHIFLTYILHSVYSLNVSTYIIFVFDFFLHAVYHLNFGGVGQLKWMLLSGM